MKNLILEHKQIFRKVWLSMIAMLISLLPLSANNLEIGEAMLMNKNIAEASVLIRFDIGWENSWRDVGQAGNHDAVWVFAKYQVDGGLWKHATLSWETTDHLFPPSATLNPASDGRGIFISRSDQGSGDVFFQNVRLKWLFGHDGLTGEEESVEIHVFGIEMVYVPEDSYYLGDYDVTAGYGSYKTFKTVSGSQKLIISDEVVQVSMQDSDPNAGDEHLEAGLAVDGDGGIEMYGDNLINNVEYPTGYTAFYLMKYEMSQGQYADFLNHLTPEQVEQLFPENFGEDRFTITGNYPSIYAESPELACNYICWNDGCAYADWAGLRPMTELEFEKACRGPVESTFFEMAWGSWEIGGGYYEIINPGQPDEMIANIHQNTGNAACQFTIEPFSDVDGPLRCGIFAASSSNHSREETGASYYGIMELSGNLAEQCISFGNIAGRTFKGHGDGEISGSGYANEENWPGTGVNNGEGHGVRGGNYGQTEQFLAISERSNAAYAEFNRNGGYGFRCARSAE